MPRRAPRPCGKPGCPRLTREKRRLCTEHLREWEARRAAALAERRKRYDAKRPSAHKRGYGRRWRKLRDMVLARSPVCECGALATEVDHKVARAKGGTDEWDNLVAMCKSCHSKKTRREDGSLSHV